MPSRLLRHFPPIVQALPFHSLRLFRPNSASWALPSYSVNRNKSLSCPSPRRLAPLSRLLPHSLSPGLLINRHGRLSCNQPILSIVSVPISPSLFTPSDTASLSNITTPRRHPSCHPSPSSSLLDLAHSRTTPTWLPACLSACSCRLDYPPSLDHAILLDRVAPRSLVIPAAS